MNEEKQSVFWIFRSSADAEGRKFQEIKKILSANGYTTSYLEAPASELSGDWLLEKLGPLPGFVFCSDADPAWISSLLTQVRQVLGAIPVIWLHDGKCPQETVAAVAALSVNDIFSSDIPTDDLLLRLRLRWQETHVLAKLEKQLKDQQVKLAKTETTLKQREEFLGVCAHDLRSPLGLIQSSLSMVLGAEPVKTALSQMHQELLTRARRQAGQALTLVNDLLDVMSFEQGFRPRFQLLGLNELLQDFYKDYSFQAEQKRVKFHYDNPIADWRVLADSDRVRQLLQNLFTNALKFTESGKNIYLRVTPFQGRRRTDPPYPMIIISLKDEGVGIPAREMQKIFDRFSQVKDYSRKDGRGLGLTVAKQISTLHDGNIWVESEEGKGSTFFVLFPHVVSRTAAVKPQTRVKKLLIAEASVSKRNEHYTKCAEWGYELFFAKDGVEVITLLFHAAPDAIVLTPGLQKMDEADIANLIKGDPSTSAVPILMGLEPGFPRKKIEDILFDEILDLPVTREGLEKALEAARKKQVLPRRRHSDVKKAA